MRCGEVLAGKYRIDSVLGQGGMGVVVRALHLQLGIDVAMKFLLPGFARDHVVVQRFLREAQASGRLKSEHVARVTDVGLLDDGTPFMVLEYLEGIDLARSPREEMTTGALIDLMLQACEALADAHAIGIVHRDIKPANFFVTRRTDGSPMLKVLDFGISKAPSDPDGHLTGTRVVMGTPAYMSPEQMRSSRNVDSRSDIWSLGVVLYELLEGERPFEAESFSEIVLKVANEPVPPLRAELPPGLADVVYRCLEKDATKRFQDIAELASAIAPYASSNVQALVSVERTRKVLGASPTQPLPSPPPPLPRAAQLLQLPELPSDFNWSRPTLDLAGTPSNETESSANPRTSRSIVIATSGALMTLIATIGIVRCTRQDVLFALEYRARPVDTRIESHSIDVDREIEIQGLVVDCRAIVTSNRSSRWVDLEDCGRRLEKLDAARGQEFIERAKSEVNAERDLKLIKATIEWQDYKQARSLLAGIASSSVYRKPAEAIVANMKNQLTDLLVADLDRLSRNCTEFDKRLREDKENYGDDIIAAARKRGVKCEAELRGCTERSCPSGQECANDRCVASARCVDTSALARAEARGDASLSSGNFAAALSAFEGVLQCKPALVEKVYLAACRAKRFTKAKEYFTRLHSDRQDQLAQLCIRENFDPRMQ